MTGQLRTRRWLQPTLGDPAPRHGARRLGDGRVRFDVWAPAAEQAVELEVEGERRSMAPLGDGWWRRDDAAAHGTRYAYRIDGDDPLPDPAARWLPDGVHAAAAVVDPSRWPGLPFQAPPVTGGVIYELHVGTFTSEGTFAAAAAHLEELVDLGVTHVEVMPVNAFDGRHGWGYDGVAWWSVHQPYGGPDAFAAFVHACHAAGLGVILDVVHNHLGPSGNYLAKFGPYLQADAESTWGKVINLDGADSDPVRAFIIGNALMWLEEYRVDALRLDAVHALDDRGSATHLLAELADAVAALGERTGRRLELIAETDRNDPATIRPRALGGLGMDAQWADDLHHAIHVAVTGETDGYYVDYAQPLEAYARAVTAGFAYAGRRSSFRGRTVGAPIPAAVSLRRLVGCVQNHDQVGNRPAGDRLTTLVDEDLVRVAIAMLCVAPHTPMLFMGEEWGETAPFQFFSDMPDEALREAIRVGRREEFAYFGSWSAEDVPDPLDIATFQRSTLNHDHADRPEGQRRRALWRDLLALRRDLPALGTGNRRLITATVTEHGVVVTRRPPAHQPGPAVVCAVNLTDQPVDAPTGSLLLSTADSRYGGPGTHPDGHVTPRTASLHVLSSPALE